MQIQAISNSLKNAAAKNETTAETGAGGAFAALLAALQGLVSQPGSAESSPHSVEESVLHVAGSPDSTGDAADAWPVESAEVASEPLPPPEPTDAHAASLAAGVQVVPTPLPAIPAGSDVEATASEASATDGESNVAAGSGPVEASATSPRSSAGLTSTDTSAASTSGALPGAAASSEPAEAVGPAAGPAPTETAMPRGPVISVVEPVETASVPRSHARVVSKPAPVDSDALPAMEPTVSPQFDAATAAGTIRTSTKEASGKATASLLPPKESDAAMPPQAASIPPGTEAESEAVAAEAVAAEVELSAPMPRAAARWPADLREALLRRAVFTGEQRRATVRDASLAASGSESPRATEEVSAAIVIPEDVADADLGQQSMDSESDPSSAERPSTAHAAATLKASQDSLVRISENSLATPEPVNAVHAGPTAQSSARTEIPATPVLVQTPSGPAELDQFVVRNARLVQSGATQTWSVRLVPETLGELRIEITSQDSHVAVRLISPHGDVRDTLDGQLHHLREALMREGVDVTRVVVASQSSSGSQLLPGDAGSPGGRSTQQGTAQGSPGQSPQSERGWSSQDGSPRGGNPSPKRHHGALELWA